MGGEGREGWQVLQFLRSPSRTQRKEVSVVTQGGAGARVVVLLSTQGTPQKIKSSLSINGGVLRGLTRLVPLGSPKRARLQGLRCELSRGHASRDQVAQVLNPTIKKKSS